MAEKRMISKTIVDSDAFLDMPQTTQNLYFHLNVRADDEGFIDSPKKVMRSIGSNQNDLEVLFSKNYVIGFETGVIVIKHWKLHNTIRKDRIKNTLYLEEKSLLSEKENGSYTQRQPTGNQLATNCTHRLEEYSIDKVSIEENSKGKKKETKHKHGEYKHVLLTENEYIKLLAEYSNAEDMITNLDEYIETSGKTYKNHNLVMRKWDKNKPTPKIDNHKRGKRNFEI